MVGRIFEDMPGVVVYNFECYCGWWGILKLSNQRTVVKCVKCGQSYTQTKIHTAGDIYSLTAPIH